MREAILKINTRISSRRYGSQTDDEDNVDDFGLLAFSSAGIRARRDNVGP